MPDIIIASSGSSATSLCYVTGQKEILYKVWCESLSTKKFVNLLRFWKPINIDYLVDIVLKKKHILDIEKVRKSSIDIYWPLTNSISGKVEYVSNKAKENIWEILRAAKSVPLFTNLFSFKGNFVLGGYYSDSPATSRFQLHIDKAVKEGATKIAVFDSWHPDDNPTNYFFSKMFTYIRNKEFRKNQLAYIDRIQNFVPPKDIEFIRIYPSRKLEMSPWEIDNENAREVFAQGYDETICNKDLLTFLR